MYAEAQAAFAAANPFQGLMATGQPYQTSQYPGGFPAAPQPVVPVGPLPQQQLVGAGDFGTGTIRVGAGATDPGSFTPGYGAERR